MGTSDRDLLSPRSNTDDRDFLFKWPEQLLEHGKSGTNVRTPGLASGGVVVDNEEDIRRVAQLRKTFLEILPARR